MTSRIETRVTDETKEPAATAGAATPRYETGVERIARERRRQIEVEGWDDYHDSGHAEELATAAACYALPPDHLRRRPSNGQTPPSDWPWHESWWKPVYDGAHPETARIRELEKAGALIAAAIDSLLTSSTPEKP